MATGAAQMMLRCVFDGSLSMNDMDIERRPFHHNCNCELHKSKGACSNAQYRNISFPIDASKISSQSSLLGDSTFRSKEDINEALSSR